MLKRNKYGYLIISRLGSTRLKNKAKLKISNKSLIEIIILKLLKITSKNNIVICTSKNNDNFYRNLSKKYKINIYEGKEKDVLSRINECLKIYRFDYIYRITGDNPLIDINVINKIKAISQKNEYDYIYCNTIPRGTRSELINKKAIFKLNKVLIERKSTEYLSYYFFRKDLFKQKILKIKKKLISENRISFSIDNKENYFIIKKIINKCKKKIFANRIEILNEFHKLSNKEKGILLSNQLKYIKLKTSTYDARIKGDKKNIEIKSLY